METQSQKLTPKMVLAQLGLEPNDEGKITCPAHSDKKPSLHVYEDHFKCFSGSCGWYGDGDDFLDALHKREKGKSRHMRLGNQKNTNGASFIPREKSFQDLVESYIEFTQTKQRKEARSTFISSYPNYNLKGELVQGFIRMLNPQGEKFFSQVLVIHTQDGQTYLKNQNPKTKNPLVEQTKTRVFGKKFQLYGTHHYFKKPAKNEILLVEGQKCVESLISQFGIESDTQFLGIWSSNSIKYFAWEMLQGKEVQLLPDHDKTDLKSGRNAGIDAMRKIEKILSDLGINVTVLKPLGKEANGYDVSDLISEVPTLSWNEFSKILEPVTSLKALRGEAPIEGDEGRDFDFDYKNVRILNPKRGERIPRFEFPDHDDDEKSIKVLDSLMNFEHLLKRYGVEVYKDIIKKTIAIERLGEEWNFGKIKNIMILNKMPLKNLQDYIESIAEDTKRNVVLEWITSKKWDGVNRFEKLFQAIRFREDFDSERHNRDFTKTWMMRALHVLTPENKFNGTVREILVFQSKEGTGKTSFFRNLTRGLDTYEKSYSGDGLALHVGNKDSEMGVLSHWIAELGEIVATLKRDTEPLKFFFSRHTDTIRLPYGRKAINFPRTTIFAGTVNDEEFLREGENTRYWVLPVTGFDINSLNELYNQEGGMQQVWAELWEEYQAMGTMTLAAKVKEITVTFKTTNEEFRPKNWMEENFPLYVESNTNPVRPLTTSEIITNVADRMGIKMQPVPGLTMVAGKVLKTMGIKKAKIKGVRVWLCSIDRTNEPPEK